MKTSYAPRFLFLAACIFVAAVTTPAQIKPAKSEPPAVKFTNGGVQNIGYGLGSVALPEGYKGLVRKDFMDGWSGVIESPDRSFTIGWVGGLVEPPYKKYWDKFAWKTEPTINKDSIKIGEGKVDDEDVLIAITGYQNVYFDARVKTDEQKQTFLKIVTSYRKGRCKDCDQFRRVLVQ